MNAHPPARETRATRRAAPWERAFRSGIPSARRWCAADRRSESRSRPTRRHRAKRLSTLTRASTGTLAARPEAGKAARPAQNAARGRPTARPAPVRSAPAGRSAPRPRRGPAESNRRRAQRKIHKFRVIFKAPPSAACPFVPPRRISRFARNLTSTAEFCARRLSRQPPCSQSKLRRPNPSHRAVQCALLPSQHG